MTILFLSVFFSQTQTHTHKQTNKKTNLLGQPAHGHKASTVQVVVELAGLDKLVGPHVLLHLLGCHKEIVDALLLKVPLHNEREREEKRREEKREKRNEVI